MKVVGDQLSFDLVKSFAESIVEGNEIYFNLKKSNKLEDVNFSIPDAIRALKMCCSKGLKEWVNPFLFLEGIFSAPEVLNSSFA